MRIAQIFWFVGVGCLFLVILIKAIEEIKVRICGFRPELEVKKKK